MSLGHWFLIAGAVFVLTEIFSFTFYLLAIGISFFIGGGFLLNDFTTNTSLYATGISMIVGIFIAHIVRKKLNNAASDRVTQDDCGNPVVISSIKDSDVRVTYRGTQWDARIAEPDISRFKTGDKLYIVKREGNLLVLSGNAPAD